MPIPKTKPINAIIVRLQMKVFANSREDKPITNEVSQTKHLGKGAGKWVKYKLPKESLVPLQKLCNACRIWNYEHTLPWENGSRMLLISNLDRYNAWATEQQSAFNTEVQKFIDSYPAHLAAARLMHQATFCQDDYPVESEIRNHFYFRVEHDPLPDAKAFAIKGIAQQAVENMQQELELRTQQKVQEAMSSAWEKMLKPLRELVAKMRDKKPIFHDTILENIREQLDLMPELNLTGSADLLAAANQIRETMKNFTPEMLRDNVNKRNVASQAAQALINQFGKVGERKFTL